MSKLVKETLLIGLTAIAVLIAGWFLMGIDSLDSIRNAPAVFDGLGWFVGLFIAASLFTAYLVIVAKIHFLLRFLAIPLWLVFTLSTIITIDQFLGHAYPVVPPKAQVLGYRVFLHDGEKKIEAWVAPTEEGGRTRLYIFPWSKENEDKLKEGKQSSANGIPLEVELEGAVDQDRPIGRPAGEFVDHKIEHRGLPPKETENSRPVEPR